jgi:acyl-ACP thioesterase
VNRIGHNARMDSTAEPAEFLPPPETGRVFTSGYPIRRTDVTPDGRLRLDALARCLQDVAEDDVAESGLHEPYDWLVRRSVLTIRGYPRRGQRLRLATFCSGIGPRWAERTTTVTAGGAGLIQARTVWVATDPVTGDSRQVGPEFNRLYGPSARGRRVSARLSHPRPAASAPARDWPLRAADLDTSNHVSNTVHWQAAEEVLAGLDWLPARAEMEYHHPILPGARLRLVCQLSPAGADLWLHNDAARLASAQLRR